MALILAGTKLTAALLNSIAPLSAVKAADESRTTNTTPSNDSTLSLAVVASGVYLVQCQIKYDAAGPGTGDLKSAWAVPTGATFDWNDNARLTSAGNALSTPFGALSSGSTSFAPGQGSGTNEMTYFRGLLTVGSTAGSLQYQFAQNTSSATATRVRAGSYLVAWRLQ